MSSTKQSWVGFAAALTLMITVDCSGAYLSPMPSSFRHCVYMSLSRYSWQAKQVKPIHLYIIRNQQSDTCNSQKYQSHTLTNQKRIHEEESLGIDKISAIRWVLSYSAEATRTLERQLKWLLKRQRYQATQGSLPARAWTDCSKFNCRCLLIVYSSKFAFFVYSVLFNAKMLYVIISINLQLMLTIIL